MKNIQSKSSIRTIFRKRNVALFAFAIGIIVTVLFYKFGGQSIATSNRDLPIQAPSFKIKRLGGYKNIRPIISVELEEESQNLQKTKMAVASLIDSLKQVGAIEETSVYFRKVTTGEWLSINDQAKYHPASLMKVPLMIAWLKMAEANPGILKQQLDYKIDDSKLPKSQHFTAPSIEDGKNYTVHDLIFYMMAYSDNRATHALQKFADLKFASKLFDDLGLPPLRLDDPDYVLSASEYSMFIKVIFNSSLNSPEFAEYGAEMMSNSAFKEGFAKGFPADTKMWHKFGEWSSAGKPDELHQSGVVFIGNEPYILTVMTRGKNLDNLASIIAKISKKVYAITVKQT
jgi:beta-lactamase class A